MKYTECPPRGSKVPRYIDVWLKDPEKKAEIERMLKPNPILQELVFTEAETGPYVYKSTKSIDTHNILCYVILSPPSRRQEAPLNIQLMSGDIGANGKQARQTFNLYQVSRKGDLRTLGRRRTTQGHLPR